MFNSLDLWEFVIFWNSISNLFNVFLAIVWVFIARSFIIYLINIRIKSIIVNTETKIDDIVLASVQKFLNFWFFFFWFYFAKMFLVLSDELNDFIDKVLWVILIIILIYLFQKLLNDLVWDHFSKKANSKEKYMSSLLKNIINFWLWIIWASLILSKLWYNITTLAAWVWISGIAIALAIQPTLASIFASFFIFLDKPFKVWDMTYSWFIKDIWLRSTRMMTFKWNEVIFPNTQIVNSWIENISHRMAIRQEAVLWLEYSTSTKKLNKAMDLVNNIISSKDGVTDDVRVLFQNFWDFSLNIWVTYFISSAMSLKDRNKLVSDINFEIKQKFEKEKIEFAYPTQTIYTIKS